MKKILVENIDTVEELNDFSKIRITTYQKIISKSYNKNVRKRRFKVGHLVLINVFQNTTENSAGNLTPKWEGPYLINTKAIDGAYWLSTVDDQVLQRSWNAIHLKTYFLLK